MLVAHGIELVRLVHDILERFSSSTATDAVNDAPSKCRICFVFEATLHIDDTSEEVYVALLWLVAKPVQTRLAG